jgi:hypothetical protein
MERLKKNKGKERNWELQPKGNRNKRLRNEKGK